MKIATLIILPFISSKIERTLWISLWKKKIPCVITGSVIIYMNRDFSFDILYITSLSYSYLLFVLKFYFFDKFRVIRDFIFLDSQKNWEGTVISHILPACPPHIPLPSHQHLPPSGTLIKMDEPILIHNHPKSIVYFPIFFIIETTFTFSLLNWVRLIW